MHNPDHKREPTHQPPAVRDRHPQRHDTSATGNHGAPKKGGRAGKFSLGDPVRSELDAELVEGHGDPNYDSENDDTAVQFSSVELDVVEHFKDTCRATLREYFVSEDSGELARVLHEQCQPSWLYEFVKQAVMLAFERSDRERELVSQLFSSLGLPTAQLAQGVSSLLVRLDDLALDTPDAPELLAKFVARAVSDDLLPPAFVSRQLRALAGESQRARECGKGHTCVDRAERLLEGKNVGEHLANIWHEDVHRNVKKLKQAMSNIVKEYLLSDDMAEAERCLRELQVPTFHFQFVKAAIYEVLSVLPGKENEVLARVSNLLLELYKHGLLSQRACATSLRICQEASADLAKDFGASTPQRLQQFAERGRSAGFLPPLPPPPQQQQQA